MSASAHFGLGVEALALVLLALLVRYAVTGGRPNQHRGPRRRKPVDEYVPAGVLIPAFAGPGWPTTAFAHCIECRTTVPVVVHHGAHRCDLGHTTTHTTTGSTL
ncbi:hypothetical protein [Streptomyces sp. ME18-1-4]|uniref:hypothetical protein n=1 Tax=Streptomyces sp. ME18-1-4 TaxID=3028685 RepID=UPI0029ADB805|nr:hypothetical protein [Streptomyces sp. ME18-1-4]MDX3243498.1 hypothetical protein [Streptomyces sp. ME18-1-4]